MWIDEKSGQET